MKHPFQIVLCDEKSHLFTTVKTEVLVFNESGDRIGHWIDPLDKKVTLEKQQQEKIRQLAEKKLKTNDDTPIKIPKIPVAGSGAPPLYNYIRSLTVHNDILVGTTDSDKAVVIFKVDFANKENCLTLLKRQPLPKRPCAVTISEKQDIVVVADKFGDVYTISIDEESPVEEKSLTPILGHVSMLSDVLITTRNDKTFILTADRDEHIRVTNYPKSYVIKSWLFGHREFILSLVIPAFNRDLLISGGGDNFIAIWNWYQNKLLDKTDISSLIEPFLNDTHLPPERFLTQDSTREVTVSAIVSYGRYFYVVCENTKCINAFEIDDHFKGKHIQTLTTDSSVIDIAIDSPNKQLVVSFDTEDEKAMLGALLIGDDGTLSFNREMALALAKACAANDNEVESRDEFHYPLYHTSTLRKRSDH